ncbi:MAG: HAD family hydrolase [Mucinivorans sp.]
MKLALIYDFDGTLSPGNMQEYDFIPSVGKKNPEFWKKATSLAVENDADPILTYMSEMIREAKRNDISLRREAFQRSGAKVELFDGVLDWFDRINDYAHGKGLEIDHYINSSGIKEMIEGTPIASKFRKIFACSFLYDVDGVAYWPAVAVNYTGKTQFLFKINKGIDEVWDTKRINEYSPEATRAVPFRNMIYIGDGTTDIPCMRLVKEKQGHAIAVYDPSKKKGISLQSLVADHRVNFVCAADYRADSQLDKIVHAVIDKIAADCALAQF